MNLPLSLHKSIKIFSRAAGPDACIDEEEFVTAMEVLEDVVLDKALEETGITVSALAKTFG